MDNGAVGSREAVNVRAGLYLAEDGAVFPITNWFDERGECVPEDAVLCVAGSGGCWFQIDLREFEGVATQ